MAYTNPLQTPKVQHNLDKFLEVKMISVVVQLTKYVTIFHSLDKIAIRAALVAICLSCSQDSHIRSMMSPLSCWLVVSNSWVCFFSSLRSFWVLIILHLSLSPSSLIAFQAAFLAESKNAVCISELVMM